MRCHFLTSVTPHMSRGTVNGFHLTCCRVYQVSFCSEAVETTILYKRLFGTPRPSTVRLMCLEKYSAIGISAIRNYRACIVERKLTLETMLLEVSNS